MVKKNKKNRIKEKTPETSKAKEEKQSTTQAQNTEREVEEKKTLQPQEENPPTKGLSKLSLESEIDSEQEKESKEIPKSCPNLAEKSKEGREITKELRMNDTTLRFGSSAVSNTKYELSIPKRGGPNNKGKEGSPYQVHVNHLPLKVSEQKRVNHYDIDISTPWRRENRKSDEPLFRKGFHKLCLDNPKVFPKNVFPAFDGMKSIYTTRQLGFTGESWTRKVEIKDEMDDRFVHLTFKIKLARPNIDLAGAINEFIAGRTPNAYSEVQILNIVLSQVAREKCVTLGRNYFPESSIQGRTVDLPGGKSVWFGFFQSVNIGWKPMLNVDVANKPAIRGGEMISYMEEVLAKPGRGREGPIYTNFRDGDGKWWDTKRHADILQKDLKGLKVRYIRPDGQKREWRCNKVMDAARNLKFEHEGKKTTVEEYFKIAYKYKLKFPLLPCLHLGSPQKTFYIPVELCEMKTQALPQSKKLGEEETAQMIRQTAVTPQDRKKRIENSLKDISNTFKDDPYAKEFGLSIEGVMSKISARVYDPPALAYRDMNIVPNPSRKDSDVIEFNIQKPGGKWDMQRGPRGSKLSFIDNKHLTKWAILDLAKTPKIDVDNFVETLYQEGARIGYTVEYELKRAEADMRNMNRVLEEFKRLCSLNLQMILVITQGKNAHVYNGLKHEGDVIAKVSTQFIQQKNIGNQRCPAKPATMHNILLKINSKLGGTNQTLHSSISPKIFTSPVMIMGADVTHPASDFKGTKQSIAAVVGSMDPKASQYKCEIRFQNSAQNEEMIHSMEEISMKLLKEFYKRTKCKPSRLIFYRDGVSEGQFLIVLNKELSAIRSACEKLEEGYNPAITFIVAQKRHKTRLFPAEPNTGVGKNQNVKPGTVVDHTITHPTEFSFFLASHEGIQM